MPHIRIVPSTELSTASLTAETYVTVPSRIASQVVDKFVRDNPMFKRRCAALQQLEHDVRRALERVEGAAYARAGN